MQHNKIIQNQQAVLSRHTESFANKLIFWRFGYEETVHF